MTEQGEIMDDNKKVEKWVLDDGRRAEKRITESKDSEGFSEKVIELHVEDERPLRLQQHIVEKTRPFLFERKISTVDPVTGEIVEQKTESTDPKVQMQLVEHIRKSPNDSFAQNEVSAQSVEEDCDCHVTKEEMIETIVAAMKSMKDESESQSSVKAQSFAPAKKRKVRRVASDFSEKLSSLGLAEEIEKRVDLSGYSNSDKFLLGVIVLQVIGLFYIVFFM